MKYPQSQKRARTKSENKESTESPKAVAPHPFGAKIVYSTSKRSADDNSSSKRKTCNVGSGKIVESRDTLEEPKPSKASLRNNKAECQTKKSHVIFLSSDDEEKSTPCQPVTKKAKIVDVKKSVKIETRHGQSSDSSGRNGRETKVMRQRIPPNWLDVSYINVQSSLIVQIMKNGNYEDGKSAAKTFKSIYSKFGKYHSEVTFIGTEDNQIRLYLASQQSCINVKKDIESIMAHNKLDHSLFARFPTLEKPRINFVSRVKIDDKNQSEWMDKIKKLNKWPKDSTVTWKETLPMEDKKKFLIKLTIDSQIRSMIENKNGSIWIQDGHQVEVLDDFDLIKCLKCFEFGHRKIFCTRIRGKCYFCARVLHRDICPVKYHPNLWYCGFCKTRGHAAVSKDCPLFIKSMQSELGKYAHKYKFVFLQRDFGRELCESIIAKFPNRLSKEPSTSDTKTSKSNLKSLVKSLVDSKMIEAKSCNQIYQKLIDHLE